MVSMFSRVVFCHRSQAFRHPAFLRRRRAHPPLHGVLLGKYCKTAGLARILREPVWCSLLCRAAPLLLGWLWPCCGGRRAYFMCSGCAYFSMAFFWPPSIDIFPLRVACMFCIFVGTVVGLLPAVFRVQTVIVCHGVALAWLR